MGWDRQNKLEWIEMSGGMEWNGIGLSIIGWFWGEIERVGYRVFRGLTGIGWGGWCRNRLGWIGMG